MLTQAIPPTQQPFKYFGTQAVTSMPQGTTTFSMPRMPMPNMYAPFNQYKQINVPPPNVIVPPPAVPDPSSQPVAGMPPPFYSNQLATDIDARRQQRKSQRRTVDYNASVIQQIKVYINLLYYPLTSSPSPSLGQANSGSFENSSPLNPALHTLHNFFLLKVGVFADFCQQMMFEGSFSIFHGQVPRIAVNVNILLVSAILVLPFNKAFESKKSCHAKILPSGFHKSIKPMAFFLLS